MKKLAIGLVMVITAGAAFAQNEYKTQMKNDPESEIEIQVGSNEVEIIGHDKDEIIITTDFKGQYIDEPVEMRKERPDRAEGLKAISVSANDNTGIGLVVEKDGNSFSVLKISKNARNKSYKFLIPDKVKLSIHDIHAEVNTRYIVKNFKGEAEIMALNSQVNMSNISGPVVANSTNGNVEIVFSKMTPEKPNSILSVNGYVDVTLPKDTKADLELNTVNGEAYTDWDIQVDKDASSAMSMGLAEMNMFNVAGKINGGGIPISIQSVNGDIYLRKSK
jgi:hypothetical protein